jgi:UDP-glucose 4-epimerase
MPSSHAASDSLHGATCVVTGGLGFIGSNLVHALVAAGAQVRVIDRLVPQHGGDIRNLDGVTVPLTLTAIDDPQVADVLRGADVVFNVAGQVSHHASMTDPLRDLDLNVRTHLGFLQMVRSTCPGVRMVYTSTRQIYGRPKYVPVDEAHPCNPVDVNGVNKQACEQLHLLYGHVHGLQATVLRLTNIYGPRQCLTKDDLGVLPVFFRRALRGDLIQLYGDGTQRRDCLHVDDVVAALLMAATNDAVVGEVVNIGNVRSWELRELADIITSATASPAGWELVAWPEHLVRIDIGDFQCDIAKAAKLLGWAPQIELEDGVRRTVDFYRQHPWYLSPSST